jgi:hypothetical protein
MTLLIYIIVALANVFLHILRSILVIKSGRLIASTANCICYTFSAVVIKFIAEFDLWIAICASDDKFHWVLPRDVGSGENN